MNQERKRGTRKKKDLKIKERHHYQKKVRTQRKRKAKHSKHTYAHTKQLQESDNTQDTLKRKSTQEKERNYTK